MLTGANTSISVLRMRPSERQKTLVGVGCHEPLQGHGARASPPPPSSQSPVKLKGRLAIAGTFLELLKPKNLDNPYDEMGRNVILYDDCSVCGDSTPHKFVLMELRPRVWGRACLSH